MDGPAIISHSSYHIALCADEENTLILERYRIRKIGSRNGALYREEYGEIHPIYLTGLIDGVISLNRRIIAPNRSSRNNGPLRFLHLL